MELLRLQQLVLSSLGLISDASVSSVSGQRPRRNAPILLLAKRGLGKTHLLVTLAQSLRSDYPQVHILQHFSA